MEIALAVIALALFIFRNTGEETPADQTTTEIESDAQMIAGTVGWIDPVTGTVANVVEAAMKLTKKQVQQIIRDAAGRNGLEEALLLAIAQKESGFNPANINSRDPSYGLFQIQTFWLKYFGYGPDYQQLLDPQFASELACKILLYFKSKVNPQTGDHFQFPAEVDIYNVGETKWAQGIRNPNYRNDVIRFYQAFGGVA